MAHGLQVMRHFFIRHHGAWTSCTEMKGSMNGCLLSDPNTLQPSKNNLTFYPARTQYVPCEIPCMYPAKHPACRVKEVCISIISAC